MTVGAQGLFLTQDSRVSAGVVREPHSCRDQTQGSHVQDICSSPECEDPKSENGTNLRSPTWADCSSKFFSSHAKMKGFVELCGVTHFGG